MVTFRRYLPAILFIISLIAGGLSLYSLGLYAAGKASIVYCAVYATLSLIAVILAAVSYRYQPSALDTRNTSLIGQLASNYARTGDTVGLGLVSQLSSHDRGGK